MMKLAATIETEEGQVRQLECWDTMKGAKRLATERYRKDDYTEVIRIFNARAKEQWPLAIKHTDRDARWNP